MFTIFFYKNPERGVSIIIPHYRYGMGISTESNVRLPKPTSFYLEDFSVVVLTYECTVGLKTDLNTLKFTLHFPLRFS